MTCDDSVQMADGGIWSFQQCYNSGYLAYADLTGVPSR